MFKKEENFWLLLLEDITKKVKEIEFDEKTLKLLEKRTTNFIKWNQKEYLKKIVKKNLCIYEFEEHFEVFITNKKCDILEEVREHFPNNKKILVVLDGNKRTLRSLIKSDFTLAKTIKFIIMD